MPCPASCSLSAAPPISSQHRVRDTALCAGGAHRDHHREDYPGPRLTFKISNALYELDPPYDGIYSSGTNEAKVLSLIQIPFPYSKFTNYASLTKCNGYRQIEENGEIFFGME